MNEGELLSDALERPSGPERAAFLDQACERNPKLRKRIETLICASEQAGEVFSTVGGAGRSSQHFSGEEFCGPFRLLETVGEGAFGVVYRAEQSEPVRREVALKRLRAGIDSAEIAERFVRERQILARLEHPNIAGFFDAGISESGRPWFAMEYVMGCPVTDYADSRDLMVRDKVLLFIDVCRGVQHAHVRGIIHRDLKPSNILVKETEQGPEPKVIDFGVSRFLESDPEEANFLTAAGQVIGTPAYMSPEQVGFGSSQPDMRSDVYALGAVLYELLTGKLPIEAARKNDLVPGELEREIRETVPLRPSQAGQESELASELRGDLDWIVLKALQKEPERRYETVAELAADLKAYLEHRPVNARPPETKYLVGRFLRRHRAGAAATLVALVSIFVALAISTTLYLGESEARRAAILETEKSRQTATFLGEILTTAGPAHTMGRDSTMMRELLVEASERLELQLRDAPEIQARLRVVIGATFNELHEYDAANSELGKALAFYRETPPTDKTKLARCLTEYGDALENIVDYERAEPILREALSIWIAEVGPNDPQTGNVQGKLAFLLAKAGRMEEAEPFASAAVALWRSDPANELLQDTIPAMGVLLKRTGRKEESLALYREELEVLRSLHPNGHPDLANCLDNLGWTLENLGRDEEAMPVLLEALEVGRHFYGDHCPHEDHVLAALSRIEGRRGDLEKQLQYAREASEVGARVFPSGHRYRKESQSVYANVLLAQAEMWLDRIHSAAKSDAEKKHALESAEERLSVLGELVEREKLSHLDLRWIGFLNAVAAAGDAAPESVRDAYRRWLEQGTPLTSMKNRKEKAERFLSMVE